MGMLTASGIELRSPLVMTRPTTSALQRFRQIDSDCTVRRDSLGKFQNSLTPATAYVEDALTRVRRKRRQSAPTKRSELYLQEFPDLCPRTDSYFVLGQR